MCYAALVEQNAAKLAKEFKAGIYWVGLENSIRQRSNNKSLPKFSPFEQYLLEATSNPFIKEKMENLLKEEVHLLDQQIENLDHEIYDLNYELALKERKGLRKKLEAKQRKRNRLLTKKQTPHLSTSFSFTYPHQNLFAVYIKDKQLEVSSFEYGHFRETGNPLDDILFHLNHSPSRKSYGLYNTRIESISPDYQSKVRLQLLKSKNQRLRQAKQNLRDYEEGKGFFTETKTKTIQSFLNKYELDHDYLQNIDPTESSYLETLFPKQRAIIVAKAFEESVLSDDYYKNQKEKANGKHMPIEFFLEDQLMYFPAIYSRSLSQNFPLSGLSIITMPPRPEVEEAGHDRSPIAINKTAAIEYLSSELSLSDYPQFFKENLIPQKLQHREKAPQAF